MYALQAPKEGETLPNFYAGNSIKNQNPSTTKEKK